MPEVGFVIGNGTSRRNFNLNYLDGAGITFGCNRLHEDYDPDYLVCIDTHMVNKVREIRKHVKPPWKFVTRDKVEGSPKLWVTCDGKPVVPMKDINKGLINNSGILAAAYLGQVLKVPTVYLIGIDFFAPVESAKNNIYNYNCKRSSGLHRVWNHVTECAPDTQYFRAGPIPESDRDFYENKLKGFQFCAFEDMPI